MSILGEAGRRPRPGFEIRISDGGPDFAGSGLHTGLRSLCVMTQQAASASGKTNKYPVFEPRMILLTLLEGQPSIFATRLQDGGMLPDDGKPEGEFTVMVSMGFVLGLNCFLLVISHRRCDLRDNEICSDETGNALCMQMAVALTGVNGYLSQGPDQIAEEERRYAASGNKPPEIIDEVVWKWSVQDDRNGN
ncbi:hypothetical protein CPLU01_08655 [Colletotrichum plurivorum]|uniref:Uncharacterized protein n=1 Tax=Colletotrichum plurivorum TaxID=2175906 RepID=A0A8H6KCF5_9PEZI|nr:hypothetical protein CPLU01_08655 [Colletotrichum plurivorum]